MLKQSDKYTVDTHDKWYRLQFKVANRATFYSVLQSIKELHGTRPEKRGTEWFWWVVKNENNARVLIDLGFPLTAPAVARRPLHGLPDKIREYQKEGVHFLLEHDGSALLGDEMGLGKTLQALGYLMIAETYPVVIVCPASLKINWMREYQQWVGGHREVRILSGRTARRTYADVFIINYDILSYWLPQLLQVDPKLIIADEATYVKNSSAARSKAFITLATGRRCIPTTGTPIENAPMELYTVLHLLRPKMFPTKKRFGMRYCGPTKNYFTGFMEYKGSSNEAELHTLLKTVMIRRLKKDVLKELPPKQRIVVPLAKDVKYDRKYAELVDIIKAASRGNNYGVEVKNKVEALKQVAVQMKMKSIIEWVKEYLATGNKLVLFGWHVAVCQEIYAAFTDQAVLFRGSPKARQLAADRFQTDDSIRLFVGNIQAAGVGLTLTAAPATATVEFGWNPAQHSQAEDRVHRLTQEADSVTAYYLVAQGTIDEWCMDIIDTKQVRVDAVVDGKKTEEQLMLKSLLAKFETYGGYRG